MSTLTTQTLTGTYVPDTTHSRIGFVARHAMVTKVRGHFSDYSGSGYFDSEAPENSTIELTIQAESIDTGNADRDGHLRSNDFFDMDNHKTIEFRSTDVARVDEDVYRVTGDLTVRGTTRTIAFDLAYTGAAVDPFGNTRIGLEGSVTVNRKDFGLNWNAALDTGGVLVSEKVTLEFDVSAIKADDA